MPTDEPDCVHDLPRIRRLLHEGELAATRLFFDVEAVVYSAEAPAEYVYLIDSGQVRILQHGPDNSTRLAAILDAGDWFGIDALVGNSQYGNRAIAYTPLTVWRIAGASLRHRIAKLPALECDLVLHLANRLEAAQEQAAQLVFDDCTQRLVKTLIQISRTSAAAPIQTGERGVSLRMTHQQLAQAVGAARETISLALNDLRRRNLLRTGRNRVSFDPQKLVEFAAGHGGPESPEE